jgi:hypothetical protein
MTISLIKLCSGSPMLEARDFSNAYIISSFTAHHLLRTEMYSESFLLIVSELYFESSSSANKGEMEMIPLITADEGKKT